MLSQPVEILISEKIDPSEIGYSDEFQLLCSPGRASKCFRLRNAVAEDAGGIARVHIQAWQESYNQIIDQEFLASLSVESRTGAWKRTLSGEDPIYGQSTVKVLESAEGEIVGFASGGARRDGLDYDGEIYAIYLLRDFKNSGLGGILFRESLEALKRRGFSGAGLWVLERNPTRAFYEKMNGCLLPEKKETKIGSKTHTEVAYGWSFS